MIVNKNTAVAVDTLWHGIIDPSTGVLDDEQYTLDDLVLRLHKNPHLRHSDLIYVPYAVSVERNNETIVIVSIEQDDLREMAQNLGCSIRDLQEEQGVRGNFGNPRVVAYAGEEREDLGPYEDKLDLIGAKECLMEWACDIVDVDGEPKPLRS